MTSKHVERGRKAKVTASTRGSTKRKSFQSSDIHECTLPSWSEVPSDDSLNDFIVDKTPIISGKRRLLFDSSDDDDEIEPLQATPVTSRSGKFKTNSRFKRRNRSATPYKSRINTHISDILIPDISPRNEKKSTVNTTNKKSVNKVFDKLVENNNSSSREQKKERFLKHGSNKIQKLDRVDLNLTELDPKTFNTATPSSRKSDFVTKTPVTTQNIPSSDVRRSGRIRKSVSIRRSNCIIGDSNSAFINRVKDQIVPVETINVEDFHKSLKTPSSSSSKKPKQTSNEETIKQGHSLKVVLQDCSNKNPTPKEDNVSIKTGVMRLKPKKEKQMERLLVHQEALYTVWKGRALVVINGAESVIESEGEFMMREGDECLVRNLEERKYLVVHYCVIG